MNKNDQLGNFLEARKFSQQQAQVSRDRNEVIREFNLKSDIEKSNLYLKYLGYRHDIRYITDYQKLDIMGYFKKSWQELDNRNNQKI